ncbi:MAG: 30S ribosomal protein S19e [Thermoplasmata archaeon]
MVTVYDVPPERLIKDVSELLKEKDAIDEPDWAPYVKTGVHKEIGPIQEDWWYVRVAAVFRKVYLDGPIGISRLRGEFGGRQRRGAKRSKAAKGSGKIIREALNQLESEGLIAKEDKEGRVVTPEGRSMLDNAAYEIMKEMAKDKPELSKYL